MLRPRYSTQFKKDYKLALRRGRDERLFIEVLDKLLRQEPPRLAMAGWNRPSPLRSQDKVAGSGDREGGF